MVFIDRTSAFRTAASKAAPATHAHTPASSVSEFNRLAATVARGIHDTYSKLEKLTKLVRKTKQHVFDDPAMEIHELTYVIKQDIEVLKRQVEQLQSLQHNRQSRNAASHTEAIISSLQTNLQKTTKQFQEVLGHRTESMRSQHEVRQSYGGSVALAAIASPVSSNPSNPNFANTGFVFSPSPHASSARTPDVTPLASISDSAISFNLTSGESDVEGGQAEMQLQTNNYSLGRLEAVNQITEVMGELQQLFRQLGELVMAQQDDLDRLDASLDEASVRIDGGRQALVEYLRSISGNRALMLKLFLILAVFATVFFVFFV